MDVQLARDTGERGDRPLVGVLGGMGPAATVDFYRKIIRATPATIDQDHLRLLIWSDPRVPDRTDAISGHGEDPTPYLIAGAQRLRDAGADLLVIPCNTAHAFVPCIARACELPIVHVVDAVVAELNSSLTPGGKFGLLATTGTLLAGFYQSRLRGHGIEVETPSDEDQRDLVQRAIALLKANENDRTARNLLQLAMNGLADRGVHRIVLACTELPLALDFVVTPVPVIDATQALAKSVVAASRAWPISRTELPALVRSGFVSIGVHTQGRGVGRVLPQA